MTPRPLSFAAALLSGLWWSVAAYAEETNTLPTWAQLMQEMAPIGDVGANKLADPEDPQARQDLLRWQHEMISQAFFALQYQDPKYPDFWPMFNQVYPYAFANPDDSYYQAVVEDTGVYRISGVRGTTRIVDFEIGSGLFIPYGKGSLAPTLAHYDLDTVKIGKDGRFEVVLSPARPKDWKGDWWQLDSGATFIWVRQRAYDWKNEVDGRFAIERLDVPAARPRKSATEVAEGLRQLPKWAANWEQFRQTWTKRLYDRGLVNKVAPLDLSSTGGIKTQSYLQGMFDVQADEALILETEIPAQCRYWSFHLADENTDTLDWMNRQTQLNGLTARRDADGKLRIVIAAKDPGVPNWLDVVERRHGMIVGRWLSCSSYPQPQVTKVKFTDVRKNLPADTPSVTPAAREAAIRAKREAAQLRRRW
ncbi:MAG: DUF1214 domain-containing protein [Steroidobacteraceae bacterium]